MDKLKEEDGCVIIDLDEFDKTPKDIVFEWNTKWRTKFRQCPLLENKQDLIQLMEHYTRSLEIEASHFEDLETLISKMHSHMKCFYLHHIESGFDDSKYLEQMEEIITFYSNMEMRSVVLKRKRLNKHKFKFHLNSICQRIINLLNLYLLNKTVHIFHVLIKLNVDRMCPGMTMLLDGIYSHYLTRKRKYTDEDFLRGYILFQKWKEIKKPEHRQKLDDIMFLLYNQTKESIKSNDIFRNILMPKCRTSLQIILHLSEPTAEMANAYFKYFKSKNEFDENDFNLLEIEDNKDKVIPNKVQSKNDEFAKAFIDFETTLCELTGSPSGFADTNNDGFPTDLKMEEGDDDDDVEFVSVMAQDKPEMVEISLDSDVTIILPKKTLTQTHAASPTPTTTPQSSAVLPIIVSVNSLATTTTTSTGSTITTTVSESEVVSATTTEATPIVAPTPTPVTTATIAETTETSDDTLVAKSSETILKPSEPSPQIAEPQLPPPKPKQQKENSSSCEYNKYGGVTPPGGDQIHPAIEKPCLYTDLMENDLQTIEQTTFLTRDDEFTEEFQPSILPNTKKKATEEEEAEAEMCSEDFLLNGDLSRNDGGMEVEDQEEILNEEELLAEPIGSPSEEVLESSVFIGESEILDVDGCAVTNTDLPVDDLDASELVEEPRVVKKNGAIFAPMVNGFGHQEELEPAEKMGFSTATVSYEKFAEHERKLQSLWKEKSFDHSYNSSSSVKPNGADVSFNLDDVIRSSNTSPCSELSEGVARAGYFNQDIEGSSDLSPRVSPPLEESESPGYESVDDYRKYLENANNYRHLVTTPTKSGNEMPTEAAAAAPSSSTTLTAEAPSSPKPMKSALKKSKYQSVFDTIRLNKASFLFHNTEFNDYQLVCQDPYTRIRTLTQDEIDKYAKITERTRKKNKEAQQKAESCIAHFDEQSPRSSKTDVVHLYNINHAANLDTNTSGNVDDCNTSSNWPISDETAVLSNPSADIPLVPVPLNLTIPTNNSSNNASPRSEFSDSPKFLLEEVVQICMQQDATNTSNDAFPPTTFLCDNSNFYKEEDLQSQSQLPTAVPETYDFERNLKNEVFHKIELEKEDSDGETRLPLKKRKLSVANTKEELMEEEIDIASLEEEIRVKEEEKLLERALKEDISYPATPMMSIAELEALNSSKLKFKTPAERKEMPPLPPLPPYYSGPSPPNSIITEQYNNHTYNNPTINYHMNNVPFPIFNLACGSYYSIPQIIVPFNSMPQFNEKPPESVSQTQQQPIYQPQQQQPRTKKEKKEKKEKKRRRN